MNSKNNTVLITGGSAGIGFEMAKILSDNGNRVIITGRNEKRLQQAASQLKNAVSVVSDISSEVEMDELVLQLKRDFPALNMVINNAGRAFVYSLSDTVANSFENAREEMLTNYLSVVRLNEKLLPLLLSQPAAAIVNVSSILAFVPGKVVSTYAASKAALHSYTQSLRLTLQGGPVKVFELMPPLVDTAFSEEIGGSNGIHPSLVARDLYRALEKDEYEIHVGNTAGLYQLFHLAPEEALKTMNA